MQVQRVFGSGNLPHPPYDVSPLTAETYLCFPLEPPLLRHIAPGNGVLKPGALRWRVVEARHSSIWSTRGIGLQEGVLCRRSDAPPFHFNTGQPGALRMGSGRSDHFAR